MIVVYTKPAPWLTSAALQIQQASLVSELDQAIVERGWLERENEDASRALRKANSAVKTMRHQLEVLLLTLNVR